MFTATHDNAFAIVFKVLLQFLVFVVFAAELTFVAQVKSGGMTHLVSQLQTLCKS